MRRCGESREGEASRARGRLRAQLGSPCLGPVTGPGTLGGWRTSLSRPLEGQSGTTGWARVSEGRAGPTCSDTTSALCPLLELGLPCERTSLSAALLVGGKSLGHHEPCFYPEAHTGSGPKGLTLTLLTAQASGSAFSRRGAVLSGGFFPPLSARPSPRLAPSAGLEASKRLSP